MTVIDIHGHVSSPAELYAYRSLLISGRGAHGRSGVTLPPDSVRRSAERHAALLEDVGTDVQFISPRPFQLMHSEEPSDIVEWWCRATNDAVASQVAVAPERFRGVCALPQAIGTTPEDWVEELERCVGEHGFIGVLINPDPAEGQELRIPRIGEEWWYPLFEKMVELDVPGLVHSAGCKSWRESYSEHMITEASRSAVSLANGRALQDFPDLKLVISHGGGSVAFQIGRWRAARYLEHTAVESYDIKDGPMPELETFDESLRRLYFDTLVHDPAALELLISTVGSDRVLFGTEIPGSGSPVSPETGRPYDDIKPGIEQMASLDDAQKQAILEGNARSLYSRFS